ITDVNYQNPDEQETTAMGSISCASTRMFCVQLRQPISNSDRQKYFMVACFTYLHGQIGEGVAWVLKKMLSACQRLMLEREKIATKQNQKGGKRRLLAAVLQLCFIAR
ncbi:MAG: hypothetical protein AAFN81_29210, partial [Bacteroidota bacterium]